MESFPSPSILVALALSRPNTESSAVDAEMMIVSFPLPPAMVEVTISLNSPEKVSLPYAVQVALVPPVNSPYSDPYL